MVAESQKIRLSASVSGQVHGVFYRAGAKEKADELRLVGYVQNVPDGVEVVAEGSEQQIAEFEKFLWYASPAAKVENINFNRLEPTGQFQKFQIL